MLIQALNMFLGVNTTLLCDALDHRLNHDSLGPTFVFKSPPCSEFSRRPSCLLLHISRVGLKTKIAGHGLTHTVAGHSSPEGLTATSLGCSGSFSKGIILYFLHSYFFASLICAFLAASRSRRCSSSRSAFFLAASLSARCWSWNQYFFSLMVLA